MPSTFPLAGRLLPAQILSVFLCTLATFLFADNLVAQVTVRSLADLQPYLNDNNANVKLAPGSYRVTADDVADETLGRFVTPTGSNSFYAIFPFEGNNSTYDFTDVTIYVETEALSAAGRVSLAEIYTLGNNNVLKNLTLVDDGDADNAPGRNAQSIVMDGANNRIEDFHVTVKGSFPYGYGDIFGKGGGSVIGHRKHSACLIRGLSNHVKDCTFIHRAYGHGIFFQAAEDPIVEGCYVEGELSTTNNVLAEEGSGSPADNVDFETVWGFNLRERPGYRFSLQEDGIRAYNGGTTTIDGVTTTRGTTGATVIDCTVVNMRSGVTIGWARGNKYVENCTVLGCETGFWVGGDTEVVNSRGDASVGPLFSEDVTRSNSTVDLTLLDNHIGKIGDTPTIYLAGTNHNLTLRDGTTSFDRDMVLQVGGLRQAHRWLENSSEEPPNLNAEDNTFTNSTPYPILIGASASDNTIQTCGTYVDGGRNNSVSALSGCSSSSSFDPDPSKTYYIDSPVHGLRLAATGEAEDPYTTSTSETGADVEWKFVAKGNGSWHIQRAAGGSKPRLRSRNNGESDMQSTSSSGNRTYYDFTAGSSNNTHFATLPDITANDYQRLQVASNGDVNLVPKSFSGSWESLRFTEVTASSNVVSMRKRNASGFAIASDGGGENGQNVYLNGFDADGVNQQWEEIDRGGGYFSYQKRGTNFSLDGGRGGADGQNLYIWQTNANNYNQQWRKVSVTGNVYRLEKRNASDYSLDGGRRGSNGQNVYMWNTDSSNQNQQWIFE